MAAKKTSTKKATTEVVEVKEIKTAKKPAKKQEVYIQFGGKDILEQDVVAAVKKAWTDMGRKVGEMVDVKIYIKPEESMAYYVINEDVTGKVEL